MYHDDLDHPICYFKLIDHERKTLIWLHSVREFGGHFGTATATNGSGTRLPTSLGSPTQHGRDALQFVSDERSFHFWDCFQELAAGFSSCRIQTFRSCPLFASLIPTNLLNIACLPIDTETKVNYFMNKEEPSFRFWAMTLRVCKLWIQRPRPIVPSILWLEYYRQTTLTP